MYITCNRYTEEAIVSTFTIHCANVHVNSPAFTITTTIRKGFLIRQSDKHNTKPTSHLLTSSKTTINTSMKGFIESYRKSSMELQVPAE